MQGKEAVVFRGDRGGVSVQVDRDAPFGLVVEELRRKLSSASDFFTGASVRVEAGERRLDNVEKRVLNELIRAHGLTLLDGEQGSSVQSQTSPMAQPPSPVAQTSSSPPPTPASRRGQTGNGHAAGELLRAASQADALDEACLLAERTLRSGQRLEFDGSVVILGDVNPGAVVIATGHVVVLGALRGMVHAGAGGDTAARVIALRLHPTQLRIAQYISRPPDGHQPHPTGPEMALVADDRIQIEQYVP